MTWPASTTTGEPENTQYDLYEASVCVCVCVFKSQFHVSVFCAEDNSTLSPAHFPNFGPLCGLQLVFEKFAICI